MEPIKIKDKKGPEGKFKEHFKKYIHRHGWTMEHMASSMYASGWPDTLLTNPKLKCHKFVEFKSKIGMLRDTQIDRFAVLAKCGINIYVLEGDGTETDQRLLTMLQSLFGPANWWLYVRI